MKGNNYTLGAYIISYLMIWMANIFYHFSFKNITPVKFKSSKLTLVCKKEYYRILDNDQLDTHLLYFTICLL